MGVRIRLTLQRQHVERVASPYIGNMW